MSRGDSVDEKCARFYLYRCLERLVDADSKLIAKLGGPPSADAWHDTHVFHVQPPFGPIRVDVVHIKHLKMIGFVP